MRTLVLLLCVLALAGCDKITGAADQKIADAEAVGFACRVAQKQPEACMKENEAQSPSSLLDGWKSADEEIKAGKLDPGMSNVASPKAEGETSAESEKKPEGDKPAEAAAQKDEKPAQSKPVQDKLTQDKPSQGKLTEDKSAQDKPAEKKKDGKTEVKHEADVARKPADVAHDKPAH